MQKSYSQCTSPAWKTLYTNLQGADLGNADLRDANLNYAIATAIAVRTHHLVPDVPPERLYNSSERPNRCVYCYNLSGANLTRTNLSQAKLKGTIFFRSQNVDFSNAYVDCSTIYQDGHRHDCIASPGNQFPG